MPSQLIFSKKCNSKIHEDTFLIYGNAFKIEINPCVLSKRKKNDGFCKDFH